MTQPRRGVCCGGRSPRPTPSAPTWPRDGPLSRRFHARWCWTPRPAATSSSGLWWRWRLSGPTLPTLAISPSTTVPCSHSASTAPPSSTSRPPSTSTRSTLLLPRRPTSATTAAPAGVRQVVARSAPLACSCLQTPDATVGTRSRPPSTSMSPEASTVTCGRTSAMTSHGHPVLTTLLRESSAMLCRCSTARRYPSGCWSTTPLSRALRRAGGRQQRRACIRRRPSTPTPGCTSSTMPPAPGSPQPASSSMRWAPPTTRPTWLHCKKKQKCYFLVAYRCVFPILDFASLLSSFLFHLYYVYSLSRPFISCNS